MLTTMLLSRFRTLEEYGTYSQMLLAINLVATFFMLGLPNSINYFIGRAETEEEKQKFLSVYYTASTVLSFVAGLLLVMSTPILVAYFKNPLIKGFWYMLAVYPWNMIVMSSIDNLLVCYQKVNLLTAYKVGNSLFTLVVVGIIQVLGWGFDEYLIVYLIGQSCFTLWIYYMAWRLASPLTVMWDMQIFSNIMRFSMPIALSSVMGTLTAEVDKLVISYYYPTEQVAIYTNAARELPVSIVAASLTAVLLPQMVRSLKLGKKEQAISLWKNSVILSYAFVALIAFGVITFAPDVLNFLYSEKYVEGVSVFRVYSFILLFRCTYFGIVLNSIGETKFIFLSSLVTLVANFFLNFVFVYLFGFIGPAISTLLATALSAILTLFVTAKKMGISLQEIFPWKQCAYITIINIGAGIFFDYVKGVWRLDTNGGSLLESIVLGMVWTSIYALILFKLIITSWKELNKGKHS